MTKENPAVSSFVPLNEEQARQTMWQHYRKNKSTLIEDIGMFRDFIVSELIIGKSVDDVFNQYIRPPEPLFPISKINPPKVLQRMPTPAVFMQNR